MKQQKFFILLAVVSLIATMLGAYFKILHHPVADTILTISLLTFAIVWIASIWQLLNSRFNTQRDRILWLLFVLFMPMIGALLFQLMKKNFTQSAAD